MSIQSDRAPIHKTLWVNGQSHTCGGVSFKELNDWVNRFYQQYIEAINIVVTGEGFPSSSFFIF